MDNTHASFFRVEPAFGAGGPARPNSILSETLVQHAEVKVVRFEFARGQELSEHTAAVAAMIHQVAGRATWRLGEATHEATPGDWAFMPAGLPHALVATDDAVVLLLLLKKSGGAAA